MLASFSNRCVHSPFVASTPVTVPRSPASSLFLPRHSLGCSYVGCFSAWNTPYSLPLNAQASSCPGSMRVVDSTKWLPSLVSAPMAPFSQKQSLTNPKPLPTHMPHPPASCITVFSSGDDTTSQKTSAVVSTGGAQLAPHW